MSHVRIPVAPLVVGGLALLAGLALGQRDPNDVDYDPHPLKSPASQAPCADALAAPVAVDRWVYVMKGNRLYQVEHLYFNQRAVRYVELP